MQVVAFDCETYPIGPEKLAPEVVCTQVAQLLDGSIQSFLLARADSNPKGAALLGLIHSILDNKEVKLVGLNTAYDLTVWCSTWPELYPKVFQALEDGRVTDCIIREKLFNLSYSGKMDCLEIIDFQTGRSQKKHLSYSMYSLAQKYLGLDLSDAKGGDSWRTRYHELDNTPSAQWPKEAVTYALDDAKITLAIYMAQEKAIEDCLRLYQQGKLPHVPTYTTQEFQTASSYSLRLASCIGVKADLEWKAKLEAALQAELAPEKTYLLYEHGLLRAEIPPQPYKNGAKNPDGTPKMKAAKAESRDMTKLKALVVDTCLKNHLSFRITEKGQELFKVDQVGDLPDNVKLIISTAVKYVLDISIFREAKISGEAGRQGGDSKFVEAFRDVLVEDGKNKEEALAIAREVREVALKVTDAEIDEVFNTLKYVETSSEVIGDLSHLSKILEQYEHRQSLQKLLTTELPRISGPVVHANFDVLKETGRTSSYANKEKTSLYPSFNIQNVHPRARLCFFPRDGWLFFSVDYSALELVALAQQIHNLYTAGIISKHSRLRDQINAGICPHAYLGAQLAYAFEPEFAAYCHSLGANSQDEYYQVFAKLKVPDVTSSERKFYDKWRKYGKTNGLSFPGGQGVETFVKTSKKSYDIIISFDEAKQMRDVWFATYPEMRDVFKVINKLQANPDDPFSYGYQTAYGMIRRGASFAAGANGYLLQSISAEGAKTAFWNVTREMYDPTKSSILYGSRALGFIHDEIFGEVLDDAQAEAKVERVAKVMVDSMRIIMKDVAVKAQPCLMRKRWNKKAEPVYVDKKLVPWDDSVDYEKEGML